MPAPQRPKSLPQDQHARFVEAAKKLGTDDDPERFKETVRQLGKAKPAERPSEPESNRR